MHTNNRSGSIRRCPFVTRFSLKRARRCTIVLLAFVFDVGPALSQSADSQQNIAMEKPAPKVACATGVIVAKTVGESGDYKPLADVLVHVYTKDIDFKQLLPPPERKPLRLTSVGLGFEPRVSVLTPGQSVIFANNSNSQQRYTIEGVSEAVDGELRFPTRSKMRMRFPLSEKNVTMLARSGLPRFASVVDGSAGFIVETKIVISPWGLSAVSGKDGAFTIERVPIGKRELLILLSSNVLGYEHPAKKQGAGASPGPGGTLQYNIQGEQFDLDRIELELRPPAK